MKTVYRFTSIMIVCLLVCGIFVFSVSASSVTSFDGQMYGTVNTDGTRLRSACDTTNPNNIIGLLYRGEHFLVDTTPVVGDDIGGTSPDGTFMYRGVVQDGPNAGKRGWSAYQFFDWTTVNFY